MKIKSPNEKKSNAATKKLRKSKDDDDASTSDADDDVDDDDSEHDTTQQQQHDDDADNNNEETELQSLQGMKAIELVEEAWRDAQDMSEVCQFLKSCVVSSSNVPLTCSNAGFVSVCVATWSTRRADVASRNFQQT